MMLSTVSLAGLQIGSMLKEEQFVLTNTTPCMQQINIHKYITCHGAGVVDHRSSRIAYVLRILKGHEIGEAKGCLVVQVAPQQPSVVQHHGACTSSIE